MNDFTDWRAQVIKLLGKNWTVQTKTVKGDVV